MIIINIKERFVKGDKDYGLVPFWFWNDDLKLEHLKLQLKEMKDKGISEFIIHAREGLQIEYLSEEWFEKIEYTLKLSKELDMTLWIYDDLNWPSGYAGGRVTYGNEELCGKHLKMVERTVEGPCMFDVYNEISKRLEAVHLKVDSKYIEASHLIQDGFINIAEGEKFELMFFYIDKTLFKPAYSNSYYIDILNRRSTEEFIRHTHMEYKKRFSQYFGNVIKGFFVDEPGIYNNLKMFEELKDDNTIAWTVGLRDYFSREKGYDIVKYLPLLWRDVDSITITIRKDFYEVVGSMYRENFLMVLKNFCDNNGVMLIGHLSHEEYIQYIVTMLGDFMSAQEYLSYAGLDRIDFNDKKVSEKITSSAAHIYGKSRVMSETFALSGWGLTLEEMKKWANYQFVRGVNLISPHAFYSSIEGKRKNECPPSEFYQNYYWKYFRGFSKYVERLSYLLSQGSHVANIGVYYPMSSAYELITPEDWSKVEQLDWEILDLSLYLLDNQIDYDFLNSYALLNGETVKGRIKVNVESYGILVFQSCINLSFTEIIKLLQFVEEGGAIIFIGAVPKKSSDYINQERYSILIQQLLSSNAVYILPKRDFGSLLILIEKHNGLDIKLSYKDKQIKYNHRTTAKEDIYFLVNEGELDKENIINIKGYKHVEEWSPENGNIKAVEVIYEGGYTYIPLSIEGYGSKLFAVYNYESLEKSIIKDILLKEYALEGKWTIKLDGKEYLQYLEAWHILGHPYFSGEAIYENEFEVSNIKENHNYILELGSVKDCAEIWVNEINVGFRIWRPYSFNITSSLREGKNNIRIRVVNTLINEFEKVPQISGLLGDVNVQVFEYINK